MEEACIPLEERRHHVSEDFQKGDADPEIIEHDEERDETREATQMMLTQSGVAPNAGLYGGDDEEVAGVA